MKIPLLSVQGLSVRVGSKSILSNISFDLHEGEVLGLFGDSGSGKSTILHTLFGLQHSDFRVEGEILLRGKSIRQTSAEARSLMGMSIVMQDLGLFDDRSIFENVAYPLRRRGAGEATIASEVHAALTSLQIAELAERNPRQISGGQRQRVALARALVYRPQILLLDEPLRGLQEELKFQFLAFMRAVMWDQTALIFVTHERSELELLAHTIVKISEGRLLSMERRNDGSIFRLLATTALIPDPSIIGAYCRVSDLRILFPEQDVPAEYQTTVDIKEWRPVSNGRNAALVKYSTGEPGWLLFDSSSLDVNDLPLGATCISFKKVEG